MGHTSLSGYGIILLMCFQSVSCQTSGGRASSDNRVSVTSNSLASPINAGDWELRLIKEVPRDVSPDRIRCLPEGPCWLWNLGSIWLEDSSGQWRSVYELPSADKQQLDAIESVSFVSHQIGWFNTNRRLYQTIDGGRSWTPKPGPILSSNGGEFRRLFFRNDRTGWIAGGDLRPKLASDPIVNSAISGDGKEILIATIWQTTDGGVTWQAMELKRLIGRFTYLEFWDDKGVAFGDSGIMFTNDGGKEWKDLKRYIPRQKDTGESPAVTGAYFVDHENGWIVTSWFEILSTHDGGKTWKFVKSKVNSLRGDAEDIVPSSMVFADKSRGLQIAGPAGTGKLLKTTDGGGTWYEISADEHFYDVGMVDKAKGFLLGDKGIYSIALADSGLGN